jgi:hypothetical protein
MCTFPSQLLNAQISSYYLLYSSADAARLAEELSQEQEHSQQLGRLCKGLELQIKARAAFAKLN